MAHLDGYTIRAQYKGLQGLSRIGFKKQQVLLDDLFPTADEIVLSMQACFHRLDESASIMYEIPDKRFTVVEDNRLLDLAVPDPRGDYVGFIVDVLALDIREAKMMMADIESTCGLVKARIREAMEIMEISEADYMRRLRESMRFMASQLRRP